MKLNNIAIAVTAALSISVLGSCGLYKKFEMPTDSALAVDYTKAKSMEQDSTTFGNLKWQDVFTDPVLADLINQALENNTNLRNAQLNVEMAHAQLKGAKLAYFPSVAFAPNGAGASYAGSNLSWSYQLPLSVSWEVDIFGKLLNSKRGAQAALYQSEAYCQAVRSQIIAGVAQCYYAISSLESQLALSRETAESWSKSVKVMENLKLAGRVNESAVVQSRAQYYGVCASIADLEVSLDQANNTMSLLMNVMPQKWNIAAGRNLEAPKMLRSAIPMCELAARPDVSAAEWSLASAYYATSSARAAFYPTLAITANGGFTNLLGSFIQNPGDWFVQLAGSLTAPLFSRGSNIARLEAAKASQQAALNTFEYTLMSAAAEVSDAMTVYEKSEYKSIMLQKEVENLELSVEYTGELLTLGTSTYLEVLTAQQGLLGAQMSSLANDLARTQAVINLYQALGGGR